MATMIKPKRPVKPAQDDGTNAPPPAELMQEIADEKARKKADKAPTTRTEMGKIFKSGGSVSARADGCAIKGKTRGKMV